MFQLVFGEEMEHAKWALERGRELTSNQILQLNLHVWIGFAVLASVLLRLVLRFRYGAPAVRRMNLAFFSFSAVASACGRFCVNAPKAGAVDLNQIVLRSIPLLKHYHSELKNHGVEKSNTRT
jgi:hypothetical protein